MSKILTFKGKVFNGTLDLNTTRLLSVPSKPIYGAVDLALKQDNFNIVISAIENNCLSFEEKQRLGAEIERRWNKATETCQWKTSGEETETECGIRGTGYKNIQQNANFCLFCGRTLVNKNVY